MCVHRGGAAPDCNDTYDNPWDTPPYTIEEGNKDTDLDTTSGTSSDEGHESVDNDAGLVDPVGEMLDSFPMDDGSWGDGDTYGADSLPEPRQGMERSPGQLDLLLVKKLENHEVGSLSIGFRQAGARQLYF